MKTSLEHKTVRPGSLTDYSFYHSHRTAPQVAAIRPTKYKKRTLPIKLLFVTALALGLSMFAYQKSNHSAVIAEPEPTKASQAAIVAPPTNHCAGNGYDKFIKISISKRRMWACEKYKKVYEAPVITGIEKFDSTRTPVGTYKIYAKQTDTVLTGSDEVGSWRRPVDYWMPFLDNQYGTYGFHDATWRKDAEFGKVDPYNSNDASHGCVELPHAAQAWLYEWAPVGTTLSVEA